MVFAPSRVILDAPSRVVSWVMWRGVVRVMVVGCQPQLKLIFPPVLSACWRACWVQEAAVPVPTTEPVVSD